MKRNLRIEVSDSLIRQFENNLKQKLSQKGTSHQGDEVQLHRAFKYFDLNDNGTVDKNEFSSALEKVGFWIDSQQQINAIFDYYDKNRDGNLDYYEFVGKIYNIPSKTPKKLESVLINQKVEESQIHQILEKARSRFQKRGKSILDVGRQFKILDDSGNHQLEYNEFRKGMIDFQVGLNEQEMKALFMFFDRDRTGSIDFDEFIMCLRGKLNSFRQHLVDKVFDRLDITGDGVIQVDDIQDVYKVDKHPDYLAGKKTKQQILQQFLTTFEKYSDIRGINDGKVTRDEFRDYYAFISSSIDNDQYFELMMNNCWKLDKPQVSIHNRSHNNIIGQDRQQLKQKPSINTPFGTDSNNHNQRELRKPAATDQLMTRLRDKFRSRGVHSIFSLGRLFKIVDDDRSQSLQLDEFTKCMNEQRLGFNQQEINNLFRRFDLNQDGTIQYDEFLRGVVGEMNGFRKSWVQKAYNKLDRDGNGIITIADIKGVYNASRHPDVINRKKTEDQILMRFLDTFETHYQNIKDDPTQRDSQVTLDEFMEYYNNVSMSIDNDQYFELMIKNAWNIDNQNYQRGWRQDY